MPLYMTRVELHGATREDYQALHQHMLQDGFVITIFGDDRVGYQLPPAEYLYASTTDYTASQVRDAAKAAANRTGRLNAVITTKADGIAWDGLTKV